MIRSIPITLAIISLVGLSCHKGNPVQTPVNSPDSTAIFPDTATIVWTSEQLQSLSVPGVCANGNVLIAGAYPPGPSSVAFIFRSTDNGTTWMRRDSIHLYNHDPSHPLWLHPSFTFFVDGTTFWGGVGSAITGDIFRSTDNGLTWSDKGINWPESNDFGSKDINSFCEMNGEIFAGTFLGVFRSTDHGTTWKAVNTGLTWPVEALTAAGPSIFAATEGEGIYRSDDAGLNWTTVNTTNLDFQCLATIGTDVFAGAFPFASDTTGSLFVSTDNGANWIAVNNGLTEHTVSVLIANGTTLYAGTNSGTFLSTNEGANWTFVSTGSESDSMGVLSLAISSTDLVVGGDGVWCYPLSQLSRARSEAHHVSQERKGK